MTHWWKNKDECVDSWMVPVQMMWFWSRRWLLRTWVAWNLVTPNMVDRNLDTLKHGYYEVTSNPVTPLWLCSTLMIATTANMVWNLITPNMVDGNLDSLWTWLLRSYLEPCYTNVVVLNIGGRKCVIIFHLLHFQQILYLTCLGAILRMHPGRLSKNLEFGIVSPRGEALAKFLGKARFGH